MAQLVRTGESEAPGVREKRFAHSDGLVFDRREAEDVWSDG